MQAARSGIFRHLTRWFSPAGTIGGATRRQSSNTSGQRSLKRQPSGSRSSEGTTPGMVRSRPPALWRPRTGIDPSSPTVYGFLGLPKSVLASAYSIMRPAYMTATCWDISAITPRSWVMKRIAAPVSALSVFMRSRIWAWMVTSSAVVGSSAIISCGLQASAMAIITRWRMPPLIWWG